MPPIVEIIITLLVSIPLYILPGFLTLNLFKFGKLPFLRQIYLALTVSLIFLPYAFIIIANIFPFIPGFFPWLIFVLILASLSWWASRKKTGISGSITGENSEIEQEPRWTNYESRGIFLYLILFSIFANLPRALMFLHGDYLMDLDFWDENFHIQQLVAVARTGIPPQHYFFPTARLAYYYGAWIYPAILSNLPWIDISLMRAMSIHAAVQTLAFTGLAYTVIYINVKARWARLLGLGMFTIMGGFDLFASLPKIEFVDWWMKDPSWITENIQISQYITLYSWVPHHLAAAMGFLVLVFLWKNIQASTWFKVSCSGIILGFIFTASPYVFIFTGLSIVIAMIANWRILWMKRVQVVGYLVLIAVLFTFVAWDLVLVYSGRTGNLGFHDIRVNVFERFRGGERIYYVLDRAITLIGLPVTMSSILLVDLGLGYIIYLLWWGRTLFSQNKIKFNAEVALPILFPVISFIFILIFKEKLSFGNFAMRGFVPAQIIITLTGIQFLDSFRDFVKHLGWKLWVGVYIFLCFFVPQSLSSIAEIRSTSEKVLKIAMWEECGWRTIFRPKVDMDSCLTESEYRYIYWLNEETPSNALILEMGPIRDSQRIIWLERNRIVDLDTYSQLGFSYFDSDFILPKEWNRLSEEWFRYKNVIEYYEAVNFRTKSEQPVYIVVHGDTAFDALKTPPVYQDQYLSIFRYK